MAVYLKTIRSGW